MNGSMPQGGMGGMLQQEINALRLLLAAKNCWTIATDITFMNIIHGNLTTAVESISFEARIAGTVVTTICVCTSCSLTTVVGVQSTLINIYIRKV